MFFLRAFALAFKIILVNLLILFLMKKIVKRPLSSASFLSGLLGHPLLQVSFRPLGFGSTFPMSTLRISQLLAPLRLLLNFLSFSHLCR
ncbi:MAG: hypothetical protein [Microviridae sp.]|nr:MAG: hypothetical protein [Microviridae sp.]